MKIAVSVVDNNPKAEVDQRFGRARGFLIYDTDTDSYTYIDNTESDTMSHGAGINAAQKLVDAGVNVVLTGQVGPKAYDVLTTGGVEIVTGISGRAEDAIRMYLQSGSRPGPGFGGGPGMGMGFGRGFGRGLGRRFGGMMGPGGYGFYPPFPPPPPGGGFGWGGPWGFGWGPADELEYLKSWKEELQELLKEIDERIKELEES